MIRLFTVEDAVTLSVGMPVLFKTGFYKWPSTATTSTTKVSASGVSQVLNYIVIDGGVTLTIVSAAATLMILNF